MYSTRENLLERYELLSKTITELEKRLKSLPEGRLHVKRQGKNTYYYQFFSGAGERYLNEGDIDILEGLSQKYYLEQALQSAKCEKKAVELYLKNTPEVALEDVYCQLSEERQRYTRPIVPGDDAYVQKWLAVPYKPKPFRKGVPVFKTLRGEFVRSKSEVIIADRLWANGIPYKYECPLKVGNKTIHPDFSILKVSTREVVYYEHCGMVDDPGYYRDMVNRVKDYNKEGIILGQNLFLSFETSDSPLDESIIDNLINANFR